MTQFTIQKLEEILELTSRSILKRPIGQYLSYKKRTNGRPINFYSVDVLKLFPDRVNLQEFDIYNYDKPKTSPSGADKSLKKSRSDSNSPRRPEGLSLEARTKLEILVTDTAKVKYLSQSDKFNIKGSVELACKIVIEKTGLNGFESLEDMIDYYYAKRIMRKDKYYTGANYRDNWKLLWESNFNAVKTNNLMPKNNWEYYDLFHSENLIGDGFGAGQLWAMDATQLDIWVDNKGKKELTSFFCIIDVITGYPLIINPILSESSESVIQTIIKCVEIWGVPQYGFILDNSRAFKSKQVVGFINLLYSQSDLNNYKSIKIFKQIFGTGEIVKYPLPKMPNFFGKAKLERAFREINQRFTSNESRALSRQSGTEKNAVKLELGTVPTKALKSAKDYTQILKELLIYLDEEYNYKQNYRDFNYLVKRGIMPNRINAFILFGGNELKLNPKMPPIENAVGLVYYRTPKINKHRITVEKVGQFRVVQNQKQIFYGAEFLTFRELGTKITVINNPNNEQTVFCYLEFNEKQFDERVREEGDIYYLGEAYNMSIKSKEELSKIKKRASLQRLKMSEINEAKYISDEVRELLEFEKELNKAKDFNNLESDKRYLDKAKDLIRNQYLLEGNINSNSEIEIDKESDLEDYYDSLTDGLIDLSQSTNLIDLSKDNQPKNHNNENNNIGQSEEIDLNNLDDLFDFKF